MGKREQALMEPPTYFRADVVRKRPQGVDMERRVIQGYSVITVGEALGHGMWVDSAAADQALQLGRALGDRGLKGRFTHPGLSADGLGTFLGRSREFERFGDQVLADLHISDVADDSPKGKIGTYALKLADKEGDAFGASIVFTRDWDAEESFRKANLVEVEDEFGGRSLAFKSPDPANTKNLRHVRLKALHASDVVDEPAANPGGMFSDGEELAWRAETALAYVFGLTDEKPPSVALGIDADRARLFVESFLNRHGLAVTSTKEVAMGDQSKPVASQPPANDTKSLTAVELKPAKQTAASLDQLEERFGKSPAFVLQQFKAGATIDEAEAAWSREKIAALSTERDQLKTDNAALFSQIEALTAERDGLKAEVEKLQKRQQLGVGFNGGEREIGGEREALGEEAPEDERLKTAWDRDPALRSQFNGSYEAYAAYQRAAARGRIKTIRGGTLPQKGE